jgi:hypothetical protein
MPKRLQAETTADPPSFHSGATGLDAFSPSPRLRRTSLPAILQSSPRFDTAADRSFIRLHPIPSAVAFWRGKSAGQQVEL